MIDRLLGSCRIACVAVGVPVATANGVPHIRAALRNRLTLALEITAAVADAEIAVFVRVVTLNPREPATYLPARSVVINRLSSRRRIARIAVGVAVAAAHRVPHIRTRLRNLLANTLEITAAVPDAEIAILVIVARNSGDSTADLTARSVMIDRLTSGSGFARIEISHAVAAAYWIDVIWASEWDRLTHALKVAAAIPDAEIAILAIVAGDSKYSTADLAAFTVVINLRPRLNRKACV